MKKTALRIISLLIISMLFLWIVPGISEAAVYSSGKQACGEHLTWSLDDEGLLIISGTGEMYSYEDHAPWNSFDVKRVVLENGITGIGSRAFSQCIFLQSIEIPDGVTSIGDYAFFRCYQLKSVTIPGSLREIGLNPFIYCKSLSEIALDPDHPYLSFENGMLSSEADHRLICRLQAEPSDWCVIPDGTQIIGDSSFAECENLHMVSIPEGVTVIGDNAFSGCEVLMSLNYPKSLVSVGYHAFFGCKNLGHAWFQEGLTSIGDGAFAYCWYLESVRLPDSLVSLGKHPFDDCRGLSEIIVSDDHPLLGVKDGILYSKRDMRMIFYLANNSSTVFSVPQGIAIIGEKAFSNGSEIKKIILPDSLREIERDAFWICNRVEEIAFSEGLVIIEESAFSDMIELKEAILPEGVISIGDRAFANCTDLKMVQIPESAKSIGKDVFANTDTLNLAVFVTEKSAAEAYCKQYNLKVVYPGQNIPDPETVLPQAFTARYPDYWGVAELSARKDIGTEEAVYLAKRPDGVQVLLCGAVHGQDGWTIIESTPLPENTRVILSEGWVMLDLGFARCTVRRYYDDIWGIDEIGWRSLFVGPHWIGSFMPECSFVGIHPWGDLTIIDWRTVTEDYRKSLRALDVSVTAITYTDHSDGRVPIRLSPDSKGDVIAELINEVPLFVMEKGSEWTKVSLGRDTENQWKLEGWIRTENLIFPEEVDPDQEFPSEIMLYSEQDKPVTLVTPLGNEEIMDFNKDWLTWLVIGEKIVDGQQYWLFWECNTEQVGFVLKEDLYEPKG